MVQMASEAANAEFALGEDAPQNMAGRAAQEAKWSKANVDARVHFSVRELLQVQKPAVLNALVDFERVTTLVRSIGHEEDHDAESPQLLTRLTPELLEMIVSAAMPGQGPLVPALLSPTLRMLPSPSGRLGTFRIFVRVRPLLPAEAAAGEYAALDAPSQRRLVCHDARLARSGRRLAMIHHWYSADEVYSPSTDEEAVCDGVLEPLLSRVLDGTGDGTALLYGQTGAGKTHTMSSLLHRVEERLDAAAAAQASAEPVTVEVTFFEVASKGCMDLLNAREKVSLRSDENDVVHACGATTSTVSSGGELRETLAQGLALRSTVETQANPISSRSHAICVLKLHTGRTLRIVDLAGSERNYETHYEKTREFQRESAAINKSLMALKDCFREAARAREQREKKETTTSKPKPTGGSAVAGWQRMRASQDEADGSSQHIDLTPKRDQQPKWTSSWRKGMVNGKPVAEDPCPAVEVPIEISDLRTGETLYSGNVPEAESKPAAEEAAALAQAIQASLEASSPAPAKKEKENTDNAGEVAADAKEAIDGKEAAAVEANGAPAAPPPVRVPYRANMPTRVLRNCFEDDQHRTAIIAAVAPGAESVIHTLNTLDHVVLMAPHLRHASVEVDVPMLGAGGQRHSYEDTPVHEWSAAQVIEWLATVDGGRFSQVVVPRGTEGKDLLRMNARKLTDLVETENVEGRADGEGWYVSQQAKVGRALFQALRDAQRAGGIRRYA